MIAALYVETGGAYFGLEGVEPWDAPLPASVWLLLTALAGLFIWIKRA